MPISSFRRACAVPAVALAAVVALSPTAASADAAGESPRPTDDSPLAAHPGAYGYFVDEWDTNQADVAPSENAAIGVLWRMHDLWTPGEEWNSGTQENPEVLADNIEQSIEISNGATDAEQERAYVIDRRNQNYTASEGLGAYADAYAEAVNLGTTIPDEAPDAALTTKFDDEGNDNGVWADQTGPLGSTVSLVEAIRGHAASSNPSKSYYQYPRPFRWSDEVDVAPWAEPLKKPESEAANDGGYPSGHTSAGNMAATGLAYAFPQQFDQLMLKAAEIGTSRIEVGMHSPLDVMGGRILSTAITAAALNDPALDSTKNEALDDAQTWLAEQDIEADEVDYDAALEAYTDYMTFGFDQIGDPNVEMRVPKGAEALLESRLPYLDDEQRRGVIHSTGLESGYPVNDDAEGWGRINLLAAANGYGAFDDDVVVTMDAAEGGFGAADAWKNDIDGDGGLTKAGTGSLTLEGDNAYEGDTKLVEGSLTAASATAFGSGTVRNVAGTLAETVADGPVRIAGDFWQGEDGTLSLTAATDGKGAKGRGGAGKTPALEIVGTAVVGGSLDVTTPDLPGAPKRIALIAADGIHGSFDAVTVNGDEAKTEIRGGVLYALTR